MLRFLSGRNEERKGGRLRAKSQDAMDGRVISRSTRSETMINIRKTEDTSPEMRDSQAEKLFEQKKPDKNDYDSRRAFVAQSDTKRPKVENMEKRPVIIKHRTRRRRTCRIAGCPARDVWKHELLRSNWETNNPQMRDPQAKDDGGQKTYLKPR